MLVVDVLERLSAYGVSLELEGAALVAIPKAALTDELRALIRDHKAELLNALAGGPGLFTFTPPGDPANDDEALQERAAIMMEGNGWNDAMSLREARWQADRERCWRAFLLNAERILAAPEVKRGAMLALYQEEASSRYGERTGTDMAASLRSWVEARRVH